MPRWSRSERRALREMGRHGSTDKHGAIFPSHAVGERTLRDLARRGYAEAFEQDGDWGTGYRLTPLGREACDEGGNC